ASRVNSAPSTRTPERGGEDETGKSAFLAKSSPRSLPATLDSRSARERTVSLPQRPHVRCDAEPPDLKGASLPLQRELSISQLDGALEVPSGWRASPRASAQRAKKKRTLPERPVLSRPRPRQRR